MSTCHSYYNPSSAKKLGAEYPNKQFLSQCAGSDINPTLHQEWEALSSDYNSNHILTNCYKIENDTSNFKSEEQIDLSRYSQICIKRSLKIAAL